jgi:MFS family permease
MYQAESARILLRRRERSTPRGQRVSRNVVLLGLTSLLTDVSAEMVATVLPIYLVFELGASPLLYGVVDGLYQGASALVRLASGLVSDRWRRYKEIAALGYGISAACKAALLVVGGSVGGVSAVVVADRLGKGVRTAPRDALISLSSTRDRLGTAFGVHRAMDTAGAMLGPLVAFGLLLAAPRDFDAVFAVSLCFAILGLAVLVLFVQNRSGRVGAAEAGRSGDRASARSALLLLTQRRFRVLVIVGAALGFVTVSDGFLYLGLQRQFDFSPTFFPLLFVGSAAAYMLLAVPVGALADRVGRARVFVAGYALLLVVYTSLLVPSPGTVELVVYLALLGAYYAMTDGVLMAMAGATLPDEQQATGMAVLVTAVTLAKLVAALAFGALWTAFSLQVAALSFMAALGLAAAGAWVALARSRRLSA